MSASRADATTKRESELREGGVGTTKPGVTVTPTGDRPPLFPGQIVGGKYEIERILGTGGMGIVASAIHLELHERVAIKAMLPEAAAHREYATRFAREAQAAARIRSEFVVRVTDVLRLADGTPAMVMEYLEGETVAQVLDRAVTLPVESAVDLVLQACTGLAEAHRMGIVHRDIKPANLFLASGPGDTWVLKVLDFGISKSDENLSITKTRGAIGTPTHMSPEQLRSSATVGVTADIWSLGVVLYESITGELPFDAPSFADLCALVLASEPPSPRWFHPDLPEALEGVILRCLRREADERFPSVLELAQALAPFASPAGAALVERIEQISTARASLPSLDEGRPSGFRAIRTSRVWRPSSVPPPGSTPPPPAASLEPEASTSSTPSSAPTSSAPSPIASSRRLWALGVFALALGIPLLLGLYLAARSADPPPPPFTSSSAPAATPRIEAPSRSDPWPGASPTAAEAPAAASSRGAEAAAGHPPLPSASGRAPSVAVSAEERAPPPRAPPRASAGPPAPDAGGAPRPSSSRFEDFGGRR